jgi:hypothetical protein
VADAVAGPQNLRGDAASAIEKFLLYSTIEMRRGLGALCIAALTAVALGQVRESDDALVGPRQERFVERLVELVGAPAKLSEHEIYLLVDTGSAVADIRILGSEAADASAYAGLLASWSGREAEFSQETGYAVARAEVGQARLFSRSSSLELPLGDLMRRLRAAGLTPHLGIRVPKHATVQPTVEVLLERRSFRLIAPPPDGTLVVAMHANALQVWAPWLIIFGPLVAMLLGMSIAVVYGARRQIDLERRRLIYGRIVRGSSFGPTVVMLPLALWLLTSGQIYPVADLWFGSLSVAPFIPFAAIAAMAPFAVLLPMQRFEARLFSDGTPPEPDEVVASPAARKLRVAMIGLIGLGFALSSAAIFAPKEYRNLSSLPLAAGFLCLFAAAPAARRLVLRDPTALRSTASDDPVVARVERLAEGFAVRVAEVRVVGAPPEGSIMPVFVDGVFIVSRRAVRELPDPEMEFAVAHALAAARSSVTYKRLLAFTLPSAIIMALAVSLIQNVAIVAVLLALVFGYTIVFARHFWRAWTREHFLKALQVTRDPDSAFRYLERTFAEMFPDPLIPKHQKIVLATRADLQFAKEKLGL